MFFQHLTTHLEEWTPKEDMTIDVTEVMAVDTIEVEAKTETPSLHHHQLCNQIHQPTQLQYNASITVVMDI